MRIQFILSFALLFIRDLAGAQNVGIATTHPIYGRLQVDSSVGRTVAIFGGDSTGISLMRNPPTIGFNQYDDGIPRVLGMGISLMQMFNHQTGNMAFRFFNTNTGPNTAPLYEMSRMTISASGNVALNGDPENSSLVIHKAPTGFYDGLILRGSQYHSSFMNGARQYTTLTGGKYLSDVLINDVPALGSVFIGGQRSRVGINRSDPKANLEIGQVNGRGLILVNPINFSNWAFAVTKNLTEPGSDYYLYFNETNYRGNFFHIDGNYFKLSDARFKTAVQPLSSALEKLMRLKPVRYQYAWENDEQPATIGLLAQEVAAEFPELVTAFPGAESGYEGLNDLLMMNYEDLAPVAIRAIQEQQEKIKALQQHNARIQQRIGRIKQLLQKTSNTSQP